MPFYVITPHIVQVYLSTKKNKNTKIKLPLTYINIITPKQIISFIPYHTKKNQDVTSLYIS